MATLGLLPVAANAASPATDGNDEQQQRRPNIIFIMCDDMGYADLGCYGQRRIETPNLDRMAQEGMRFTQAYAGSPVSAPSRASFMTGQHAGHTHVRGNREYWRSSLKPNAFGNNSDFTLIGQEPYLMTHRIIPEVMKEAGYTTGMFGKWAGGYYNMQYPDTYLLDANGNSDTSKSAQSSSASLPNKRGVDCYYGYICQFQAHTYYPNFLNRYDPVKYGDKHVVVDTLKQNILHKDVASGDKDYENREQYTSDLIHQYALDWIDRQTGEQPFMGIFTYTLPHAELWQPNDSLVQKYTEKFQDEDSSFGGNFGSWYYRNYGRRAQFAAMVSRLDAQVGEIFDKLKEKGFDENTLVIFTSDNGPHEEGGADPAWFNHDGQLRGTKRSTHEGGIRVPFIAKGPGVPAGTVNDHQLAFYDVMPTLLDYAGLDGSQYSMKASTEEHRYDGISFKETLVGNDDAQEKHEFLYWEFHETNMMAVRMGDWKLVVKAGTPYLYDLSKDLHEDTDVAVQNPKIVRQMIEIIHEQHTESGMFGVTLPEIPDESVVVTEVKTDKLYTIECQPNDGHTTRFISDNDGTVNGQTAKGTKFRFEEAIGGGYYIKSTVSGKYINANDANTDISFDSEAKSAWTIGKLTPSDSYVYFTIGKNQYLNNHNGGADNLRLATHNPIGASNYCSLWTLHEYAGENAGEGEDGSEDDLLPADVTMHFSFSRGTSLDNTEVAVTDAKGQSVEGVSAQISAGGAESWLTGNQATADSILCLNVNTNATTADKPIVFTLQVNGLGENVQFSNFTFSSVALNASGLWQNYTETRHCNFLCSYGTQDGSMAELPMIKDESIMVANGTPKYVAFDVENVSPVDGGLTIELKLYKGTENGGCFYGLTGITLNGNMDNVTGITSADAALRMRDGKFIEDEQLVIIRNGVKYNTKGQRTR